MFVKNKNKCKCFKNYSKLFKILTKVSKKITLKLVYINSYIKY